MIESPLLRSVGAAGVFDPTSGVAGLPFDIELLLPEVIKPSPDHWQKNLELFHEWAHFYQFATTSYGFLYKTLTTCQLYLVNGFLSLYRESGHRCSLPLLDVGARVSLPPTIVWQGHLRFCHLLQRQREAVFGYSPFPADFIEAASGEWAVLSETLYQIFGAPKIAIGRGPGEQAIRTGRQHRIDDLLESHAHALSCSWLMQAVEHFDLPKGITSSLLEYANLHVAGPYGAFLRYSPLLPTEPKYRLMAFCSLCDLALNPPAFHLPLPKTETTILFMDHVWSPVNRLARLLQLAEEKKLPVLRPDREDWMDVYLAEVKEALGHPDSENVMPFRTNAERWTEMLIEKTMGFIRSKDGPMSLALLWLDAIATFRTADQIRSVRPLLLGSAHIDQLSLLFKAVAGPSVVCRPAGQGRIYHRVCAGLLQLGLMTHETLEPGSQWVCREGVSVSQGLLNLLHCDRRENEALADAEPFGEGSLTLSQVLGHYGLTLADFD